MEQLKMVGSFGEELPTPIHVEGLSGLIKLYPVLVDSPEEKKVQSELPSTSRDSAETC
jgi:hypothetical protein